MSGPQTFNTIVEHLSVPLVVVRAAEQTISYANPAAENTFRISHGALIGLPVGNLFQDPQQFHMLMSALARRGKVSRREALVRRADGTAFPVEVAIESLFFDDEPAIVTTFHDLTALHRVGGDLKISVQIERLLAGLSTRLLGMPSDRIEDGLETALAEIAEVVLADSGFVALFGDGEAGAEEPERILEWTAPRPNEASTRAWAWLLEDHLETFLGLVSGEDVVRISSRDLAIEPSIETRFSLLAVPLRYDGSLRAILGLASSNEGKSWLRTTEAVEAAGRIFANVLQRRDAEIRMRKQQEILSLERQKANKLEAVGILAGGIAHDFRNILLIIQGNASLAQLCLDSQAELSDLLHEIQTASKRAKALTEQLLTFSRGGAPVKEKVSLRELIQESVHFCLRGSKVICRMNVSEHLWPIDADAGQINQVLNNLLINANQAMSGGGEIQVRADNAPEESLADLQLTGRYARIVVTDTGSGISPEHLEKIFDPYFTTKPKGSGLGLATTHSIVKNHDGKILVESVLGHGTTFTIFLPAADQTGELALVTEDQLLRGEGRVLVVDDEAPILRMAKGMLEKLGYEAEIAEDGMEAIEKYRIARGDGRPFDVVLMDLTIPGGLGGRDAAAKLLSLDPDARIVVSSGYSGDPVMSDYRKYGFVDVLPKPFVLTKLGQTLHRVLLSED